MDQAEDRSAWQQGALVRAGCAATRLSRQRPQANARQDCLMGWNRNDCALRQSTRITVILENPLLSVVGGLVGVPSLLFLRVLVMARRSRDWLRHNQHSQ